jgi:hypothetical protein
MAAVQTEQSYGEFIGDMYARWTLEDVIEIAHAVSMDYVARPEFYHGSDVPDNIVDLRSSYGYLRNYPDRAQRQDIIGPVLGASDGCETATDVKRIVDKFRQYREPLFKACIAYTLRSVVDAPSGLKVDVIKAMSYFPQYLRTFAGASLKSSFTQLQFESELAYDILRSHTVSAAFGVKTPPAANWPLEADDQNGSSLINAISNQLQLKVIGLDQEKFTKLRSLAQDGREALEDILRADTTDTQHFETLVRKVYTWAKSIDYCYLPSSMAQSKVTAPALQKAAGSGRPPYYFRSG